MIQFKGTIFVTNNPDIVRNADLRTTKIISLDEEGILGEPNKDMIYGTCLLPPILAKQAESDGDEDAYDMYYSSMLLEPYQQTFIAAIISCLFCNDSRLLLFLPSDGYTYTMIKLVEHLYKIYGIHPGILEANDPINANCYYDARCIPIWLNLTYSTSEVMSPEQYLYLYPQDAVINNETVMMKLIADIRPLGDTIQEKINTIESYRAKLHVIPKLTIPVRSIQ
jgi:hypothetical protein